MKKMFKTRAFILVCVLAAAVFAFSGCTGANPPKALPMAPPVVKCPDLPPVTAPSLTNNPTFDMTLTNSRPLLSVLNAKGGEGKLVYEYQISKDKSFPEADTLVYKDIEEHNSFITEMRIPEKDALPDGVYFWRVRACDEKENKGPWAQNRFILDTKNTQTFSGFLRLPVKEVSVSSGQSPNNIIDWNDPGQLTYWNSSPPGPAGLTQWVLLDMGNPVRVSRFWMLSNPSNPRGRLLDFIWQYQTKMGEWKDIEESRVKDNDTYRNTIEINPVESRYFRLYITGYQGLQAQINCIIPYAKGFPAEPYPPQKDYVLVIGDQMNGFTYTMLVSYLESLDTGLEVMRISHDVASLKLVNNLSPKPLAIVVSGNNANYPNMPMFEYYGVFDIIRNTDIPLLGICAGHQFTSMAYGMSFARSMGWLDASTSRMQLAATGITEPWWEEMGIDPKTGKEPINIIKKDLPIFKGMPDPFLGVEIHSWAISPNALPEDHEVTSKSSYVQTIRSTKRHLYGAQFHGEAVVPYNQGGQYILNFLNIAKSLK